MKNWLSCKTDTHACLYEYILKLAAIGIALLLLAVAIFVCDPVQIIADWQIAFRPGSIVYNVWQKPPIGIFIDVYVFNITNLQAFRRGQDRKLKVSEVGPYVYQEFLENQNVTFNDNNTVTYIPHRIVKFVRERSVGDPREDFIIVPNVPYMGIAAAASDYSIFAALAINTVTVGLNSQPVLRLPVYDYLWGYEDRLVSLASTVLPRVFNFQRFGLLERMFDEGHNVVTMTLPPKDRERNNSEFVGRSFSIDRFNGLRGMPHWGHRENENNTACNTLNDAFEGILFPHNISKNDVFPVYRKAFCRTLPIVYSHPKIVEGVSAYNFKLKDDIFESDLQSPDSACFCKEGKCLQKGLGSISPCYYNIPLALSFPHFLNSDPALQEFTPEGMTPNETRHGTFVAIQPQIGVPLRLNTRFQINLLMGNIKSNSALQPYRNMVLPIFWIDINADPLTPNLYMLLRLLFNVCPYLQLGVIITLLIVGISLVGSGVLLYFWADKSWQRVDTRTESPLVTAGVNILPLLRKGSKQLASKQELQQQKPLLG